MPLDRHCPVEQRVFRRLERFADAFEERTAPGHLLEVLEDESASLDGTKLGQEPERFVEDNLVWEVLEALYYEPLPRPQNAARFTQSTPDFTVTNLDFGFDFLVFGEVKPLNDFESAKEDMMNYLQEDLEKHVVAFATDGLTWEVYFRSRKQVQSTCVTNASLRQALEPLTNRHVENGDYDSHELRKKMVGVDTLTKSEVEEEVRSRVEEGSWERV
jgi:hypothetical protein